MLRRDNLASKSVFVIKLACAILALKTSTTNLLNSEVSIYLSWLWLLSLFSILLTKIFVAKLLMLGISFSTVVNAVFVDKLLISEILFLTVVNAVFVAKLLKSGILSSISVILAL